MEKKTSRFTSVGDVLAQRGIEVQDQPVLQLLDLVTRWAEVVGETVSHHSTPVRLSQGQLSIEVTSPVWAHQLQLMTPQILQQVQVACPKLGIRRLRFTSR